MSAVTGEMTVPVDRALAQRRAAIVLANDVRHYRAFVKQELAAGRMAPVDALRSTDRRLQAMPVRTVLLATPKVGKTKANKAFVRSRIDPRITIGKLATLGPNRLADLVKALPQILGEQS